MANTSHNLTTRQVAESLGVSESSVKRWVDEGEIEAHRTAGGHRRISLVAALGFIRRQRCGLASAETLDLPLELRLGGVDDSACEELLEALLEDQVGVAQGIIAGRFVGGAQIAEIGDRMIQPAMAHIGALWEHEPDGILIEHRAVATCVQVLSQIGLWLTLAPEEAPMAVTAAGPEDPYQLAPLLAQLTLIECGVRVRNLGPLTPMRTVALAVERYGADLCVMSVSIPIPSKKVSEWAGLADDIEALGSRLVVGGRCAETLPPQLSARLHLSGAMCELAAFAAGLVHGSVIQRKAIAASSSRSGRGQRRRTEDA